MRGSGAAGWDYEEERTHLRQSRLKGCNLLNDADLGNANLEGSTADNAQLGRCRGLMGAQLADGTKVNDAVWAELLELP